MLISQVSELLCRVAHRVSGHSKPATKGRMKTSHFEGSIASWAAEAANDCDEQTQRELAAFDFSFGGQWLVAPTYCPRVGDQSRDSGPVSSTGPTKTSHFDRRVSTGSS